MYTIKDIANIVGESEHTIRFYCKEGLFPFATRDKNNVRKFTEADIEGVNIVLCLRDTGMPLSEIKHYMDLCTEGISIWDWASNDQGQELLYRKNSGAIMTPLSTGDVNVVPSVN